MKNFLVILLIAIIACEAVEQEIDFKSIWDTISDAAKKAWDWLNSSGAIEIIKAALIAAGKAAAIAACSAYFTPVVCSTVIGLFL